ncbi:MAG TPA: Rrf2 family transcriptional regulator [Deltaproteobacteria bacterium]|nr:MAG: Rrf2 family transcriptional regulator [Deltaproteobacteria bacterium GWA2_55_82]OGQ64899.1 MAG: Rrf2 family transcriptional regulator [Deltaproteobacteria bacterium RIFCSPLOWO2_02_FULL_55_12]OIJ73967.1 MAG: Rrf2 family transcriptional regulator [Deltaproteobacteria bacterium GWC2_55_46]HBG46566.1 Rrf2 family transcriptional regulator [Deltaproteobacteria bacterium]HCY09968.1 Rrf2 family transcriptional regulator [Deltaproteobacteria bacterium]
MLQLTRDGEYAVRAIIFLASQPEGKISLITEIAEAEEVPKSYLSKIMQHLVRSGLVRSRRGINGGFMLAKPADSITLRQAIEAIEGPIFLNICLVRKGECHMDDFCPVHPVWHEAQKKLFEVLDGKTIAQLAKEGEALAKGSARGRKKTR